MLAAIGLSATGATAASAAPQQTSFPGSVPAWATPAADQGAAPADTSVEGEIYLPLRDQQGAEQLATAVSTPGSRQYRQTLSPAQWIGRFSPTPRDYNLVVSFLKGKGLTITSTPKSRLFIVYRGTADQVGAAFATQLHSYAHDGHSLVAPSSAPSVPNELAGLVSAIGLDQAKLLTHPTSLRPDQIDAASANSALQRKSAATPPPITVQCSNYYGEHTAALPRAYDRTQFPTYLCGYTPAQLRSAYGIQSLTAQGLAGQGQTVAITDAYASPSIVQDVNTYSAKLGEPGLAKGQYSQIVPKPSQFVDQELCQYPSGWQGEQTLDVEAVHALAPAANILYVGGFNCGGGLDTALSTILDSKLATIVSNSWGDVGEDLPVDVLQGQSHLFLQAAGEGIGLYFSSGDNGDEAASLGQAEPDFPASSPWVTSVGGTSMGIDKSGKLVLETGWGTGGAKVNPAGTGYLSTPPGDFFGGAGGGTSTFFAQPAYQKGIVPDALAKGRRVSPDVAALADPYTGFLIGISPITDDTTLATGPFENETYGGTSLASPLTAAQVALVQQAAHAGVGFANPTLYAIARVLPSAYRDVVPTSTPQALAYQSVTSGNRYLITLDRDTSLKTARRYDDVTGLGGISFTLLSYLAQGRH